MLSNKLDYKFIRIDQPIDVLSVKNMKIILDFLDAVVNDSNLYQVQKSLILKLTYAIRCVVDNNFNGTIKLKENTIEILTKEE